MTHELTQQAFSRSSCVSCSILRTGELVENKTVVTSIVMDLKFCCRLQILAKYTNECK